MSTLVAIPRPLRTFASFLADLRPKRKLKEIRIPPHVWRIHRNFWYTEDYAKRWRTTYESLHQQFQEKFPMESRRGDRGFDPCWMNKLPLEEQVCYWRIKHELQEALRNMNFWTGHEKQERALLKQYGLTT